MYFWKLLLRHTYYLIMYAPTRTNLGISFAFQWFNFDQRLGYFWNAMETTWYTKSLAGVCEDCLVRNK